MCAPARYHTHAHADLRRERFATVRPFRFVGVHTARSVLNCRSKKYLRNTRARISGHRGAMLSSLIVERQRHENTTLVRLTWFGSNVSRRFVCGLKRSNGAGMWPSRTATHAVAAAPVTTSRPGGASAPDERMPSSALTVVPWYATCHLLRRTRE